jgi:hypothetical protein
MAGHGSPNREVTDIVKQLFSTLRGAPRRVGGRTDGRSGRSGGSAEKGCFDAIDHHVLMDRVRRRIQDRKVLRLVLAFLKADIMIEGSLRHPVAGTPQGGIMAP